MRKICATPTYIISQGGLLRDGLERLLQDTCYDLVHCRPSISSQELEAMDPQHRSIVIINSDLLEMPSKYFVPRHHDRPYRLVVLLHRNSTQRMVEEFSSNADGILSVTISAELLIKSLDLVMEGVSVMPSEFISLPNLWRSSCNREPFVAAPDPRQVGDISEREMLVLQRLMQGASNKAIARHLGIAEATVKVHVKAIFRKACLHNRTQVALWATQQHVAGEKLAPGKLACPGDSSIAAGPMREQLVTRSDSERALLHAG